MKIKKTNSLWKNLLYSFLIFLFLAAVFSLLSPQDESKEISFSEFVKHIENKEVQKTVIRGDIIKIELENGEKKVTQKQAGASLEETLGLYGISAEQLAEININLEKETDTEFLLWMAMSIIPIIFIGFFFWWIMKQGQQGNNQAFSFGKAKAKRYGSGEKIKEKVSFKDVAGLEEAKEELKEVVEFLKIPKKFLEMGAKIPKGVLLVGPPGCGKTLLARAVASEAKVPFFSISGSEFVEMFVGVGASRVRDLFSSAKKNSPAIIFLDELDAVGRHRGAGLGGGNDEREQTLNQILVEMDGFEKGINVIVIAATNRPDILDPALLRPGRFDRRVVIYEPDIKGRKEILKIHSKGKKISKSINLKEIAERTPGFSGADLANLMNESAILAAKRDKKEISQDELRESIEKVLLGPERKSHILLKEEKKITAYHEAGHAIVSSFMPKSEPIQKISIISRGMAAGYTLKLPGEQKYLKTKKEFSAELATFLGGYSAENIKFNEVTTGASNDLHEATNLARELVMKYGMSSLGPITFGKRESLIFLGKEISEQRNFSEGVAQKIDKEVETLIRKAEDDATKILIKKKTLLEKIANILIEKETIEKKEFEELIKVKKSKIKTSKEKGKNSKNKTKRA